MRRNSVKNEFSKANIQFVKSARKCIQVRTPRQGRRLSIAVMSHTEKAGPLHIARLNFYDKKLKKHAGPLSLENDLESIVESRSESREVNIGSGDKFKDREVNENKLSIQSVQSPESLMAHEDSEDLHQKRHASADISKLEEIKKLRKHDRSKSLI